VSKRRACRTRHASSIYCIVGVDEKGICFEIGCDGTGEVY
jgi:hypothetical protein